MNANTLQHLPQSIAASPMTILGQRSNSIPIGGTIRAGIKVLTRNAANNPHAVKIYEDGVAAGLSFDIIEGTIQKAVPGLRYPLVPRNVDYFTVRRSDFPNPETAREILEAYGEDRGEGLRLYRFPIVFASDQWQAVMPHSMTCFYGGERRYWSDFNAHGQRICCTRAPAAEVANGKRVLRQFGKRDIALRQDNGGVCDPESCPEYQNRQCNLSGRFIFYIPGIKSISAIQVPTRSFYSMDSAIQKFNAVSFMRGGRLAGYVDGRKTPFYMTKVLRDITFTNEEGQQITAAQWVIDIEAPVDVAELLRQKEDSAYQLSQAAMAANLLEVGVSAHGVVATDSGVVTVEDGADDDRGSVGIVATTVTAPPRGLPEQVTDIFADAPSSSGGPSKPSKSVSNEGISEIETALGEIGIEAEMYMAYADKSYGAGWRLNPNGRRTALDEIAAHRDTADELQARIIDMLATN